MSLRGAQLQRDGLFESCASVDRHPNVYDKLISKWRMVNRRRFALKSEHFVVVVVVVIVSVVEWVNEQVFLPRPADNASINCSLNDSRSGSFNKRWNYSQPSPVCLSFSVSRVVRIVMIVCTRERQSSRDNSQWARIIWKSIMRSRRDLHENYAARFQTLRFMIGNILLQSLVSSSRFKSLFFTVRDRYRGNGPITRLSIHIQSLDCVD